MDQPRNKRGEFLRKQMFPTPSGPELWHAIMVRRKSVTRRRRVLVRASVAAYG